MSIATEIQNVLQLIADKKRNSTDEEDAAEYVIRRLVKERNEVRALLHSIYRLEAADYDHCQGDVADQMRSFAFEALDIMKNT